MKMKNIAAVAMAGCMAASLAACGGSASSAASTETSTAASTEAATGEESTGTANGFTVEYGPNPETLDPALNNAIDGANTLITVFERCCSSIRTTRSSPVRLRATLSAMTVWSGPSRCVTA